MIEQQERQRKIIDSRIEQFLAKKVEADLPETHHLKWLDYQRIREDSKSVFDTMADVTVAEILFSLPFLGTLKSAVVGDEKPEPFHFSYLLQRSEYLKVIEPILFLDEESGK